METQVLSPVSDQIREQAERERRRDAANTGAGGLLRTGETIDGYVVRRLLSLAGGEAEVYLCEKNNQNYALKYFYTRGPDPTILEKLFSFSGKHPGIVSYIAAGKYKKRHFLILEYAGGGALDDKNAGGTCKYLPLSEDAAVQIVQEVSNAFDICHKNGIIHRDIKPGNLFYKNAESETSGNTVLVGDFGIASAYDADQGMSKRLTKAGNAHTIGYAAPELFGGHKDAEVVIGPEVDYYALGVTLWALLTGKDAFVNENGRPLYEGQIALNAIQGKTADLLLARSPELSGRMRTLIRGLLTHRHDKRWGCQEIRRFLAGEHVEVFTEAARDLPPLEIAGRNYYDYPSIALALLARPEQGKTLVFTGKLVAWLIRIDQEFAEKILDLADAWSAENRLDEGLVFIAYSLCPSLPFKLDEGKAVSSLPDMISLLETYPDTLIPYLRDEKRGFYIYLDAVGLGDIGAKVREVVRAVPDNFKLVSRITVALQGNVIAPFQDGINNNLEPREMEQLYNLPDYLKERTLLFIERRSGDLPAWIENLTGKNLELWLYKIDHQKETLIAWGAWKYFTLFLQENDIQSGKPFEENGKKGFKDPLGNVLLPPVWDDVGENNITNRFIVKKDRKRGVVSADGKTILPFEYDAIYVFDEEWHLYQVKTNDEWQILTEDRRVLYYRGEELRVHALPGSPFAIICDSTRTKLYSKDFKLVKEFGKPFAVAGGHVWHEENSKVCIYNGKGEKIKETPFSSYRACSPNSIIVEQGGLYGAAGGGGNVIVPPQYSRVENVFDFFFVQKNGKWGLADAAGTVLAPCEYDTAQSGQEGFFGFEKNDMVYVYQYLKKNLVLKGQISGTKTKMAVLKPDGAVLLTCLYVIGLAHEFDRGGFGGKGRVSDTLKCFDGREFLTADLAAQEVTKREPEKADGEYLRNLFGGDQLWQFINTFKKQNKIKEMNLLVNAAWKPFFDNDDWETARRVLFFVKPDNMEGLDGPYDYYRSMIGNTLIGQKNYEDAVQFYEEATKLNPSEQNHWNGRGDVMYNLKQYKEAITCFTMAIDHAANDEERARFNRSRDNAYAALGMKGSPNAGYQKAKNLFEW